MKKRIEIKNGNKLPFDFEGKRVTADIRFAPGPLLYVQGVHDTLDQAFREVHSVDDADLVYEGGNVVAFYSELPLVSCEKVIIPELQEVMSGYGYLWQSYFKTSPEEDLYLSKFLSGLGSLQPEFQEKILEFFQEKYTSISLKESYIGMKFPKIEIFTNGIKVGEITWSHGYDSALRVSIYSDHQTELDNFIREFCPEFFMGKRPMNVPVSYMHREPMDQKFF